MVKKIIGTVIGSLIIGLVLLSFIEVYYEPEATEQKSFTYALGPVVTDLGVDKQPLRRELDIVTATSRGLVTKTTEGKIENVLVEEIKIGDNNIQYEFVLKQDIKWSDGSTIEASDIIDYFKELIILGNEEDVSAILNIYGAREFRDSEGSYNSRLALIEGDNSVIIRLNSADEKFVEELSKPIYRIRNKTKMWSDINNNYSMIKYSGIYEIDKITNEKIILKKNKTIQEDVEREIEILKNVNEEVSMAKFETGDIDLVVDPPSQQLNRLEEEKRLQSFSSNKGKYVYLNSSEKALAYKERKAVYKNLISAMEAYYKNNSNYIEMSEYSYFQEDKKNLNSVQERKVKTINGKEEMPEIVTLMALDTQENRGICEFLQKWFKENTKTNLRYSLVNNEDYKNISFRDRYDITLISVEVNGSEREKTYGELEFWLSETEVKTFEKLKVSGKNEFRELENKLFVNYKIVPLIFEKKNVAISSGINGIKFDYYGNIDFSNLKGEK